MVKISDLKVGDKVKLTETKGGYDDILGDEGVVDGFYNDDLVELMVKTESGKRVLAFWEREIDSIVTQAQLTKETLLEFVGDRGIVPKDGSETDVLFSAFDSVGLKWNDGDSPIDFIPPLGSLIDLSGGTIGFHYEGCGCSIWDNQVSVEEIVNRFALKFEDLTPEMEEEGEVGAMVEEVKDYGELMKGVVIDVREEPFYELLNILSELGFRDRGESPDLEYMRFMNFVGFGVEKSESGMVVSFWDVSKTLSECQNTVSEKLRLMTVAEVKELLSSKEPSMEEELEEPVDVEYKESLEKTLIGVVIDISENRKEFAKICGVLENMGFHTYGGELLETFAEITAKFIAFGFQGESGLIVRYASTSDTLEELEEFTSQTLKEMTLQEFKEVVGIKEPSIEEEIDELLESIENELDEDFQIGIAKVVRDGNKTVVRFEATSMAGLMKFDGESNCNPNDTFDEGVGYKIAKYRALEKVREFIVKEKELSASVDEAEKAYAEFIEASVK